MKILVTAFDPFGGDEANSSQMVVENLPDELGDIEIKKLVLPTVYNESAACAWNEARKVGAEAILALGQAGGRRGITAEVIGINYAYAHIADNAGAVYDGERLLADGEAAYFSTVPVVEMVKAVKEMGFEADLSLSAGGFVCNSLLYRLLANAAKEEKQMQIGFVHLPYEKSQNKDGFSMEKSDMCLCVEKMIQVIGNKYGRN